MTGQSLTRRHVLKLAGVAGAGAAVGSSLGWPAPAAAGRRSAGVASGYVADGLAGADRAFPLGAVTLLTSPFLANRTRNAGYLHFVDPDRLLHTFRRNVGLPSDAMPCGGWEGPTVELRGHSTGHLLSGLALDQAVTGDTAVRDKGRYLVAELAKCQDRATAAGFHPGYLSAFPESFFDRLESGQGVWAPYYTLHKIMAGLVDQYELAGDQQALDVVSRMADWVVWRNGRLTHEQMQDVLRTEHGGMNEVLANLHRITGAQRYLDAAEMFRHDAVFDPLAQNRDELAGLHANTQIPKMVGALRMAEETGSHRYFDIGANFWRIVVDHHTYIIGGNSNGEAFRAPDVIAGELSGSTCENCNSYNMLKLTRLLHFHQPERVELIDYYERTLFNQMLGEQDPDSEHGFNIYYTGLQPGAYKRQPGFMSPEDAYSTDYTNFSCDHGTGMETHAKFSDTIYSRDKKGLYVNLFVPSELDWTDTGLRIRQTTGFPDEPATTIEVLDGAATTTIRVRVPGWVAAAPEATVNGKAVRVTAAAGSWLEVKRHWRAGDTLRVTLPMGLGHDITPDDKDVRALTYGPVVLSGAYGDRSAMGMPRLEPDSVTKVRSDPLEFTARADDETVRLIPIARMHHQHYNVYWYTGKPYPPPPEFAVWHRFDETSGTSAADATGHGMTGTLVGGASWVTGKVAGAVALDGAGGHVRLADGVLNGASDFAVATWVRLDALSMWSRIFDLGTGTGNYLFLTPRSGDGTLRFAITAGGAGGEQQINAAPLPTGVWTHVVVSSQAGTGVLYVDGKEVGRNDAMTVQPRMFRNMTANYVGRSQYSDPYLKGQVDDLRIYGRGLSPAEVAELASGA